MSYLESIKNKFSVTKITLLAICLFIFYRGITLELFDFTEPTEARYAAIGADMLHTNNWVVPQFPRGLGHEPYLGKPPLFFWSIATSQLIFGFDVWASRLPSFISGLLTAIIIFLVGRKTSNEVAFSAVLIWFGTTFCYFFSGAVMLDTVLTFCVSLSTGSYYLIFHELTKPKRKILLLTTFWLGIALGFLTKGPVALIFTALPILYSAVSNKNLLQIKTLLWPPGIFLFFLVVVPWFVLAEIRTPGFLEYFFYNENFLRFFVKNYGDRYGSGHTYPYGSVWWMLFLGMLPWSLYFLRLFPLRKLIFRQIKQSNDLRFFIVWAISIPLFLSLIKQLHPGYVLPAFPGICLSLAWLRESENSEKSKNWDKIVKHFLRYATIGTSIAVIAYAIIRDIEWGRLSLLAITIIIVTSFLMKKREEDWENYSQLRRLSDISIYLFTIFFTTSLILSKEINERSSPSTILNCVAESTAKNGEPTKVSIVGNRSYTAHYLNEAWDHDLASQLIFKLAPEPITDKSNLDDHVIVKEAYKGTIPKEEYTKVLKIKSYIWYVRKSILSKFKVKC